ncbi:MAG: hypothetical protein CO094_07350 [Anaerolineae bacterium CG_4_9_14_3_um_filter_57_17]|nr:hypothetical protein [bacterium]NCT21075.1 hypothetical protein [bacterium]OIO87455.1 MAG: hypothetical protein AUK01_00080 [Anaerolineae bacterium CG2_30_57_67]PJB66396.1 MAG: hypothetical protein CO094_07350 [Anaerolineae bacterium CG_4_9_14_3_um_filter_57_17]
MESLHWLALGIVVLTSIGIVIAALLVGRKPPTFRDIPAFRQIRRAVSMVVEDGSRLHISLGRGSLLTPFGASALAGLSMLRQLGETTSLSDRPSIATSGDGVVNLAAQDTLRSAHEALRISKPFDINRGQLTGLTPFSYAAGALPIMRDNQISTNVLIGNYGIEIALMTEAAEREGSAVVAASDNLPAQAVLYATTPGTLIGEELFAAGAYNQAGNFHIASLLAQDVLRWLVILALLAGAILKALGVF